jgi:glycosyltransferase involved in cell wall biosynthesis
MQSSIHVARWVEMIPDQIWDLHMFPVDAVEPNPNLGGVTLHWPEMRVFNLPAPAVIEAAADGPLLGFGSALVSRAVRFGDLARRDPAAAAQVLKRRILGAAMPSRSEAARPQSVAKVSRPLNLARFYPSLSELGGPETLATGPVRLGESCNTAPARMGPGVLASVIRRIQPDLIHSMEFQHAGYLVLKAKELYGEGFPTWLATNWGSDIYYFRGFADHASQIRRLLSQIDVYSCECARDIEQARQLGYSGPTMPILPNSGGFDLAHLSRLRSSIPTSKRKLLMIKGYHHFAGRAMTAMKILETFSDRLKEHQIVLYSVSSEPRQRALELIKERKMNIKVIDWAPHDEILFHFGRARLYLGVSISDGISTSVLESMAMGAFPIQTNTSCCDEWFTDGEGGFIVSPDNFDMICERFQRALEDDALVDGAAEINQRTVKTRLARDVLVPKVAAFYDEIFARHVRQAGQSA